MPDKTSLLREKLLDLFMDAPIAAAAKSFQELEQSLESDSSVVFILFGDICSIGAIVELVKQKDKVAVVHMDLIDGLAAREAGVDFIKTQTRGRRYYFYQSFPDSLCPPAWTADDSALFSAGLPGNGKYFSFKAALLRRFLGSASRGYAKNHPPISERVR